MPPSRNDIRNDITDHDQTFASAPATEPGPTDATAE